jgi:pimeloyl-ACP methyl ester carboxylesterase
MTASEAAEKTSLGVGKDSFVFVDARGNAETPLKVWTYQPKQARPDAALVFVMHGAGRNGEDYRDAWIPHAERYRFLLVVPEFAEKFYSSTAYQQGNLFDENGQLRERSQWAYAAIEHLFDHVKSITTNKSELYYLYGHSGGGQFVHRLVLFFPEARYARAIAANPGYYTMPDMETRFPYGLEGTAVTPETLAPIFRRDFVVLLGEKDTKRDDPNLRKTPEADAQGPNRLERGKRFYEVSRAQATTLRAPYRWQLRTVPNAGHSNQQMSETAARLLFGR